MSDDKYKKVFAVQKQSSTQILREREQLVRKCAIIGCNLTTAYISNYCKEHRVNVKKGANPLKRPKEQRAAAHVLADIATEALCVDLGDESLFERTCKALDKYRSHEFQSDLKTIQKYKARFSNQHKSKLALWLALQKRTTPELLSLALGSALSLYQTRDFLAVTQRHFALLLDKALSFPVVNTQLQQGVKTRTGNIISTTLDENYSPTYWRNRLIEKVVELKRQELTNQITNNQPTNKH